MARGRVKAVRKYPFWIERKGTGTKLEDIQSVAAAVREARQEKVADNANVGPWVKIRDGPDAARKSRTKAFWGSGVEGATMKMILNTRAGRLPTHQNLCIWKSETSPECTMCPNRGGCQYGR